MLTLMIYIGTSKNIAWTSTAPPPDHIVLLSFSHAMKTPDHRDSKKDFGQDFPTSQLMDTWINLFPFSYQHLSQAFGFHGNR